MSNWLHRTRDLRTAAPVHFFQNFAGPRIAWSIGTDRLVRADQLFVPWIPAQDQVVFITIVQITIVLVVLLRMLINWSWVKRTFTNGQQLGRYISPMEVFNIFQEFWSFYIRLNSEKLQNFHFKASIVIFEETPQKLFNKDEFPDFYEFTLYKIFEIFHVNSHYRNGDFRKINAIHI